MRKLIFLLLALPLFVCGQSTQRHLNAIVISALDTDFKVALPAFSLVYVESNNTLYQVNGYFTTAQDMNDVIAAGSATALGAGGFSDPMTTIGDIIIRNAANATARLGVGTNGQVLKSDGTNISWGTDVGFANPLTTQGDIIVQGAGGTTRLGVGANTYVLTSDGTDVSWAAPTGGDTSYFDLTGAILSPKTAIDTVDMDAEVVYVDGRSMSTDPTGGGNTFLNAAGVGYVYGQFGTNNIVIGGTEAGYYFQTGTTGNILIGGTAGRALDGGDDNNIAIGAGAMRSVTTASRAVSLGYNNLYDAVSPQSVVSIGTLAGFNNNGDYGVYVGSQSGYTGDGDNCIFLGYRSGYYETGANTVIIDNLDRTNEANQRLYAPFYSVTNATPSSQVTQIGGTGKVGIGTTSPSEMLHVIGNGLFTGNLSVKDTIEADIIAPDDSTATYFTSDINVANDIYADSLFVNYLGGTIGEVTTDTLNVDSLFVNADLRDGAYFLVADGSGNVVSLMDTTGYKGGGGGSSDWTRSGDTIYPTTATDNIWGKDTIFVGENGGTTGALALIDGANMNTIQSYGSVVVIPTPAQGLIMQGRNYTNPGMYYASSSGTALVRPEWATNSGFGGAASAPEIIVSGTYRVQCDSVVRINDILMIVPRSSAPSNPVEGWIYSNSTDHHLYYYNDSTWVQLDN